MWYFISSHADYDRLTNPLNRRLSRHVSQCRANALGFGGRHWPGVAALSVRYKKGDRAALRVAISLAYVHVRNTRDVRCGCFSRGVGG